MNLLTEAWIPIQQQGSYQKITLQQLLCGEQSGELCLPRDDMELACLQLLCAITQVLFTPKDKKELGRFILQPLTPQMYAEACKDKLNWFDLDHPETPFMQFKGVRAEKLTSMDKLLAGVADGTSKAFVNPANLGSKLCGSCTAIALFNMANNAPSVGGGFQGSFRGNTPITVFVKDDDLRIMVWLNVLSEENIKSIMPWYDDTKFQRPNYIDKVNPGASISSANIGLNRGLLWQPAYYELLPSYENDTCSCCGCESNVYSFFKKEKFKYSANGYWPHPLSPTKFEISKEGGKVDVTFASFTTFAPAWTHLSSFLFENNDKKDGSSPPPVIEQIKPLLSKKKLHIIVGGYRYKPPQTATITERRHEMFTLAAGWNENELIMRKLITVAIEYRKSLRRALYSFVSRTIINPASKKNKDRIGDICGIAEANFYQQTEGLIHNWLSNIKFNNTDINLYMLHKALKEVVIQLFNQTVEPYQQEPKMLKALALARRSLHKSLQELEPEGANT